MYVIYQVQQRVSFKRSSWDKLSCCACPLADQRGQRIYFEKQLIKSSTHLHFCSGNVEKIQPWWTKRRTTAQQSNTLIYPFLGWCYIIGMHKASGINALDVVDFESSWRGHRRWEVMSWLALEVERRCIQFSKFLGETVVGKESSVLHFNSWKQMMQSILAGEEPARYVVHVLQIPKDFCTKDAFHAGWVTLCLLWTWNTS